MESNFFNRPIPVDYANACAEAFQNAFKTSSIDIKNITNLVAFSASGSDPISPEVGSGISLRKWINELQDGSYTDITVQFGIYIDPTDFEFGAKVDAATKKYLSTVVGRLTVFIVPCNQDSSSGVTRYIPVGNAFNLGQLNP